MNQEDLQVLKEAVWLLENPSWAAHITNIIGMPFEFAPMKLSKFLGNPVTRGTEKAIKQALFTAVSTMDYRYSRPPSKGLHQLAAALCGDLGASSVGLASLLSCLSPP